MIPGLLAQNAVQKTGDTMTGSLMITSGGAFTIANDSAAIITVRRFSNNASASQITQRKGRGTTAAPSYPASGDAVANYDGQITDDASAATVARLQYVVTEPTPGATAAGGRATIQISPLGSATLTEILRLEHATGMSMFGTNPVIDQNRLIRMRVYTVATLPAAGTAGRRAAVSDATAPAFLAAVAGGGAVFTPVIDNGAAWVCG